MSQIKGNTKEAIQKKREFGNETNMNPFYTLYVTQIFCVYIFPTVHMRQVSV